VNITLEQATSVPQGQRWLTVALLDCRQSYLHANGKWPERIYISATTFGYIGAYFGNDATHFCDAELVLNQNFDGIAFCRSPGSTYKNPAPDREL
jgi:hypothetical protein